jgi:hypothetical protein
MENLMGYYLKARSFREGEARRRNTLVGGTHLDYLKVNSLILS